MTSYTDFLIAKEQLANAGGFPPTALPGHLFDFQTLLVDWAVRQGRAAIFADCGLGKTPMSLAWADQICQHTGYPVLLLTPLAVGFQIVAEAEKFGHDAAISRDGSRPAAITVTNYEQIDKFNPDDFGGVVCDESSAIKAFDGERRKQVTEFLRRMPYRLLGTATAAPNDYIELGTSSEALGQLGYMDMLNRFFKNDNNTSDTGRGVFGANRGWRFKGHAQQPFWRWVSSWARAIRTPSDYGYDDNGFHLPPLHQNVTLVDPRTPHPDHLFETPAFGLTEEREENRRTLTERCETAAAILEDAQPGIAWCNLNDESTLLTKLIDGAVELTGSEPVDTKEAKLKAFSDGQIRVLVTKPRLGAFGLNWQHCHRMTYFPSHSYEQYYQAIRRCWRFGQHHPVTVDVVTTPGGQRVLANLQRKSQQADDMFTQLIGHMRDALNIDRSTQFATPMEIPAWL